VSCPAASSQPTAVCSLAAGRRAVERIGPGGVEVPATMLASYACAIGLASLQSLCCNRLTPLLNRGSSAGIAPFRAPMGARKFGAAAAASHRKDFWQILAGKTAVAVSVVAITNGFQHTDAKQVAPHAIELGFGVVVDRSAARNKLVLDHACGVHTGRQLAPHSVASSRRPHLVATGTVAKCL
jgi:hypothetical protein